MGELLEWSRAKVRVGSARGLMDAVQGALGNSSLVEQVSVWCLG